MRPCFPPDHEGDEHRHQAQAPDPAPARARKPKIFVHTPMVTPECFNLNFGHLKIFQKMEVTEWSRRIKGVAKQSLSGYRHFPANFPQLVIGWQKVF